MSAAPKLGERDPRINPVPGDVVRWLVSTTWSSMAFGVRAVEKVRFDRFQPLKGRIVFVQSSTCKAPKRGSITLSSWRRWCKQHNAEVYLVGKVQP